MLTRSPILFFVALASQAASFPEYPVKSARDYPTVQEESGLFVAAVPVEDQRVQRVYFGINLRMEGYIPVLLVIENHTTRESYLLRKEALMYSPAGRSGSSLQDPSKASRADTAVLVGEAVPIYSVIATIATARSKEVRQNLLISELQSATLSPGVAVHGFIFIPSRRGYSSRQKIKLSVPFVRSGTDQGVTIECAI